MSFGLGLRRASVFMVTGFLSLFACNNITNTTAIQCTSEAECLGLGGEFAGTTCDPVSKTCVKSLSDIGSCSKNQECIDRAGGAPAICRRSDKKCVTLLTPECPAVYTKQGNSELADDNVVVIGSVMPGPNIELGIVFERAVELAHFEISNNEFRGLPPVPGATAPRPLAIVACREFGAGREGANRAARHLADDIQVPLTIGPINPTNYAPQASQIYFPKKILNILPVAPTNSLANLPGNPIAPTPLNWRIFYDDRAQAKVTAEFITNQLEPLLIARGVTPPVKIAMVASGDLLGQSFAQTMLEVLKFNGVSAGQNLADGNLISLNIGDFDDPVGNPNPDGKIGQAIGAIFQQKPNIILHEYTPTAISKVFFGLEGGWPDAAAPRPFHIGASAVWNGFGPLFPFLSAQPFRNGRVFGIQNYTNPNGKAAPFPITSPQVQTWLARFNERNPEFSSSVSSKSQLTWAVYDATYLAAYAISALRDKPVTGDNIAAVLGLFNAPGTAINTFDGPTGDMSKAFTELLAGRSIDLQGLLGSMSFDTKVGAPTYGLEITCPVVDANTKRTTGMRGSGFHFLVEQQQSVVTSVDGMTSNPATSPLNGCPPPPP